MRAWASLTLLVLISLAGCDGENCFVTADSGSCTCLGGGGRKNDVKCNPTVAAVCCASADWGFSSSVDSQCECQLWTCQLDPDGSCYCGAALTASAKPTAESCSPSSGGVCCAIANGKRCACGATPCASDERRVPDCSAANGGSCIGEHDQSERVDSCRQ